MSKQAVLDFIDAINAHNMTQIVSLMAGNHSFIDAYGNQRNRPEMIEAWPVYLSWFPDYQIDVEQIFVDGGDVAVFGYASGTYRGRTTATDEYYWRLPAAWKASVANGKIRTWQVFCDSKMPFDLMDETDQQLVQTEEFPNAIGFM